MAALELVDGWGGPGAAAAVVRKGGEVLATTGDSTHLHPWASVTKLVTALATLVAVEEGSVRLDDPAGPPGATVHHLLAHTSGLPFEGGKPLVAPGRRRIYSNTGFEILGEVVAQRTGIPFETYMREAVLDPLGMDATCLQGTPAAGLVGPLDDLVELAKELLSPTLVGTETFRAATAVAFAGLAGILPGFGSQNPMDWGLGFEIRDGKSPHWTGTRNSPGTFGHFGGSGSFLWADPEAALSCVLLSGREFDEWAIGAWPALSDAVLDEFA